MHLLGYLVHLRQAVTSLLLLSPSRSYLHQEIPLGAPCCSVRSCRIFDRHSVFFDLFLLVSRLLFHTQETYPSFTETVTQANQCTLGCLYTQPEMHQPRKVLYRDGSHQHMHGVTRCRTPNPSDIKSSDGKTTALERS
jgi:hypothetical protein